MNKKFNSKDDLKKESPDIDTYLKFSFTRRCLFLSMIVIAGITALFARAFYLQVPKHQYYSTRAKTNRIRRKPLPPERGNIYDTNGIALTENILRYQVKISPGSVKDIDDLLIQITKILPLSEKEITLFKKAYVRTKRYETATLKSSITEEEYYHLSARLFKYPGVEVQPYFQRYYPFGSLTTHVVGYTGRISDNDVKNIGQDIIDRDYIGLDFIGKTGIEKQYEDLLRGKSGYQQVETDANGNLVRVLEEFPAQKGDDLYLSLDINLQRYVDETLGEDRGACVAINTETGGVIALVSKPNYDCNLFARGITARQNQQLLQAKHSPLFNRAIKGRYSPGSVIKPSMYLAGLHYDVVDKNTTVNCTGNYLPPNSQNALNKNTKKFHCWKRWGHGRLNGEQAIEQSCDVYFYTLGYEMGINEMSSYLREMGYGRMTGIDLPGESAGIMPTRQWKESNEKTSWYIGDTINASIGQGYVTTTPLQLAVTTALIARDGMSFTPYLLKQRYSVSSKQFISVKKPIDKLFEKYNPYQWRLVKKAMEDVITQGTGRSISSGLKYKVAGKSGTVQVISYKTNEKTSEDDQIDEHKDNALFIAYAPAEKPTIAVSLIIERGGGGSHTAAPLVRKILDYYILGSDDQI